MLCENCNEEAAPGAFFCGGCGRPLGFRRNAEAEPSEVDGLTDVPPPESSREDGPVVAAGNKALCNRCMGAYPEDELATVDGERFCGDCSSLTASRSAPQKQQPEETRFAPPRTVVMPDERASGPKGSTRRMALVLAMVVAVVGIVAAVALPGSDRIDRLLSGANDDGGEIRLAQTYVAGECFEYGMSMKLTMTMESESSFELGTQFSGDVNVDMALAGLIRIDVLSVDTSGNGRIYLGFSEFEGKISGEANGRPIDETGFNPFPDAGETSVTMTIDPYGKVMGTPEQEGPGLGEAFSPSQLFGEGLDGAPRGTVKVGDTWRGPLSIPMDAGGRKKMKVQAEYEVEGFLRYKGRSCIAISVEGSLSAYGGGFEVEGEMKGAMLIDSRSGCLVKSAMDADVEVSTSSSAGSASGKLRMSMDIDLK